MDGQVRLVYRHMAFLGPESVAAAEASECAGEQGRFWPYHDRLFAEQEGRRSGSFGKPALKRYAAELALNTQQFDACVDTGRYADLVRRETEEGRAKGVQATPTIFVNGRSFRGVPTWDQMLQMLGAAGMR